MTVVTMSTLPDAPAVREAPGRPPRSMERCELQGQHEHSTVHGQTVQIWTRDSKYLARWRQNGCQHGHTLGADVAEACHALRLLLTNLENGTYRKQRRGQRCRSSVIPQHTLRTLIEAYLEDRQRISGQGTAQAYRSRLNHSLDFAEQTANKKRWPKVVDLDRSFATELKTYLMAREVTRNGATAGRQKPMSAKMVRLCLEVLRGVFGWALRADVRQVPAEFINPITSEIMGPEPSKDPHRPNPVPLDLRIRLVRSMDAWQLLHLTPLFILPTRFEDLAGALISDIDWGQRIWKLGSRMDGDDFNKGHANLRMPVPDVLLNLWQLVADGRSEGPLFRSRRVWECVQRPRLTFQSLEELQEIYQAELRRTPAHSRATSQDRKRLFRNLLAEAGAVSTDAIGREIRDLYRSQAIANVKPYDLRSAVTTEMHRAGLSHLELRYLTMHSTADILNDYTSLDVDGAMAKYFATLTPLWEAIRSRAEELKLKMTWTNSPCQPTPSVLASSDAGVSRGWPAGVG